MTEQLHFHFSLACIGKGNGNPFQYSCLENPRDGGAWWAVVYGVAQDWTRLQRLSSSSSSGHCKEIEENNGMGKTRDLFKKIRAIKGTFHARIDTIMNRNGKNLTEAEESKKS